MNDVDSIVFVVNVNSSRRMIPFFFFVSIAQNELRIEEKKGCLVR